MKNTKNPVITYGKFLGAISLQNVINEGLTLNLNF